MIAFLVSIPIFFGGGGGAIRGKISSLGGGQCPPRSFVLDITAIVGPLDEFRMTGNCTYML